MNTTLIIGFDSAWSANNRGAIVGVLRKQDGTYLSLGDPLAVNFVEASQKIKEWLDKFCPKTTLILIDQPTIVENTIGQQRDVENIVGSPVGRRNGGVMSTNTGSAQFGIGAPIREFMSVFGGPADLSKEMLQGIFVIETYPVLTLIAMNWLCANGRLPKYNPDRKTFRTEDWKLVCDYASTLFKQIGLQNLDEWAVDARKNPLPALRRERKQLQDCLDACICLIVGLRLISGEACMFVGNMKSGYMVVPYENESSLYNELEKRCQKTGRTSDEWLHKFNISG